MHHAFTISLVQITYLSTQNVTIGTVIVHNNGVWTKNIFFCLEWLWWYSLNRFQWVQCSFKYMEGSGYLPTCDTSTLMISNAKWTFLLCVLFWIALFHPSLHVHCKTTILSWFREATRRPNGNSVRCDSRPKHHIYFLTVECWWSKRKWTMSYPHRELLPFVWFNCHNSLEYMWTVRQMPHPWRSGLEFPVYMSPRTLCGQTFQRCPWLYKESTNRAIVHLIGKTNNESQKTDSFII